MNTITSVIKWEAKQDWAYEMVNWQWISKKDVEDKWGWIWSSIKYTIRYDEKYKKDVVDKIVSVNNNDEFEEYKNDLNSWYFKEKDIMKDNFIWKWYPEFIVNKISSEKMNYTQVRKYFDEVNFIKRKLDVDKNSYIKQDLIELYNLLEYDSWKKDSKISKTFKDILDLNLEKIINSENINNDFKWFYNHFKAIIAYARCNLKNQ